MANNQNNRPELIFWFDTPPKVSKGAFNFVSKNWGNKVIYICKYDYPEYRKKNNWNDGDFGDAEVIMLKDYQDSSSKIENIIARYPNAINVLAGFTTDITKDIFKFFKNDGTDKVVLFTERPVDMGNLLERFLRKIYFHFKYRYYHQRFKNIVKAFLPLGSLGVKTFAKYGWTGDNVYPFMYNPESRDIVRRNIGTAVGRTIKFLYVGRFYYKTKGVDVLMKAVDTLKGCWSLDMVGGYGKNTDEVIAWADKNSNVNYLGAWKSEHVCENMQDYDIVVVPSRYDGWNLLINEAINANIGVISTNQAVSDEMIQSGGMGIVVPGSNPQALAEAMQAVINSPQLVDVFKQKSAEFMPKATPDSVGKYFMDILDYTFGIKSNRPECPWLL